MNWVAYKGQHMDFILDLGEVVGIQVVNPSDAVVVGAPVGDGLFDGLLFEVLGEGLVDEGGEFLVGGEAEADELLDGELVNVREFVCGKEGCEPEALFEADEAVLQLEVVDAAFDGEDEERERADDGPVAEVGILVAEVNGDVDRDAEIDHEDREDKEVQGWIEARVVLVGLWGSHEFLSKECGLSIACGNSALESGLGWRDGSESEEADWGSCRNEWWGLDGGGARGECGREYVSDIFVESADVEGDSGEAGRCGEDAGVAGEA